MKKYLIVLCVLCFGVVKAQQLSVTGLRVEGRELAGENAFRVSFGTTAPAKTQLFIYSQNMQVVRVFSNGVLSEEHSFRWDGNDDKGNRVLDGIYFYRLQFEDMAGNRGSLDSTLFDGLTDVKASWAKCDMAAEKVNYTLMEDALVRLVTETECPIDFF